MPDITMCNNSLCPKSERCYKFKAKPSEWQSMATFNYTVSGVDIVCEHFEDINSYTTTNNTEGRG